MPRVAPPHFRSLLTRSWGMHLKYHILIRYITIGIVRAPISTTGMQVSSRLLLVWGVVHLFPSLAKSAGYSSMLLAWSVTEVIRYSFFVLSLNGFQPKFVTWLRYNTFYVLYPLGISSECWMIWKAVGPAKAWRVEYAYLLQLILFIYIPGKFCIPALHGGVGIQLRLMKMQDRISCSRT